MSGDEQGTEPPFARPVRRPWNLSGYIGAGAAAIGFAISLLTGNAAGMLVSAFGLALCLTGLIRVHRGRATNRAAVLIGLGLAIGTFALQFLWASRAEPCQRFAEDEDRYLECYNEYAGLL